MTKTPHWIINHRTKTFIFTDTETWDGDWKERYSNVKDEPDYQWVDAQTFHDFTTQGIPYAYDLCTQGMLLGLYVDTSKYSTADIKAAEKELRHNHDIHIFNIHRLTPA